MKSIFYKLKKGTEKENYGRHIIKNVIGRYAKEKEKLCILDLGAGLGDDLKGSKEIATQIGCSSLELFGLESYPPNIEVLINNGVEVKQANIEVDEFPYENRSMDIIIMNQCLEHTKEIFHIFSEIGRVLKTDGIAIIGVPNLASLHNRILLLMGKQPSAIHTFGPHVRGFTKSDFVEFAEIGGLFKCIDFYGSNFYPFSQRISRILCKLFPKASVSIFFVLKRCQQEGKFSDVLDKVFFETPYLK